MKREKTHQRRIALLVCLATCLAVVTTVLAVPPDSTSGPNVGNKKKYWICRRHESDKDKRGNIALIVRIEYDDASGKTTARIAEYPARSGGNYTPKPQTRLLNCSVSQPGTAGSIKLEKMTLTDPANGTVMGWIVRTHGGKGSAAHKNRGHARLVFRYAAGWPRAVGEPDKKPKEVGATDGCEDEEPNDDVLEEEAIEPPANPTSPPALDYTP
jgi:hypothetical protein